MNILMKSFSINYCLLKASVNEFALIRHSGQFVYPLLVD